MKSKQAFACVIYCEPIITPDDPCSAIDMIDLYHGDICENRLNQ